MGTTNSSNTFSVIKKRRRRKKISKEEEAEEDRKLFVSELKHSFCKTVHKSQGSEYKYVILYIPQSLTGFININLLYTAITRTKEKIWLVSDKRSLDLATTKMIPCRYEKLSERLVEMRMEDEDILEKHSKKRKIEIEEEDTAITNDDIWEYDDYSSMPKEMSDYYNL